MQMCERQVKASNGTVPVSKQAELNRIRNFIITVLLKRRL